MPNNELEHLKQVEALKFRIEILEKNVADLEIQLRDANRRIMDLLNQLYEQRVNDERTMD